MIWKLLPLALGAVCALVTVGLDYRWYDRRTKLFRRLRLALALALVGALAVSVVQVMVESGEQAMRMATAKRLRLIAHAEVRLAVRVVTDPFFVLFRVDNAPHVGEFVPPHVLDDEALARVEHIDIRSHWQNWEPVPDGASYLSVVETPGAYTRTTWAEVLREHAERGSARIDRALQIYAAYMEPEVISLLSELRTSEFLELRLRRLTEFLSDNKAAAFLPFPLVARVGDAAGDMFGYREFWGLLQRLDDILEKDAGRLRRRL